MRSQPADGPETGRAIPAGNPTAGGNRGLARHSIAGLLREAARLDRTQSDPVVAARNAIGVVAPLVMGTVLGSAASGLPSTIGALQTAFADRPGPYRLRLARMLGTALAAATTSALAVLASGSAVASVVLLLVLGFAAGLLLTAGPSATQVGTAAVATALILGHTASPASVALHVALLVLAGGALQTLLAVAAWPIARHRPERVALAALYRELAAAARLPRGAAAGPPAGVALTTTRQTLYGLGHDHGPSVEAYRVLLDEAERVRREIVVIAALAERLADDGNPILAGFVRESLTATGAVLDEVADALAHAREVDDGALDRARGTLRFAVIRLEDGDETPGVLTRRAAAARLRALSGQLRAVVDSTGTGASEGGRVEEPGTVGQLLRDPVAIVRANLTPDSAVLRHAVRVAVFVAGSDLVTRLAGLDRGYWVSLTILVVLRPDFGATFQRSVMRTLGTVVGLLVASELVHWIPGGSWWDVTLIAIFAFGMRVAGPGNVALSAVSLSGLVVVLLAINGIAPHATLVERSVSTLAGGVLAIAAALTLPTWERDVLPARMAALLAAYAGYLRAVADPDIGQDRLQRARTASRLARTNAQASVDRARAEPVPAPAAIELGRTVLAHSHRFIHAAVALDALRPMMRAGGGLPELGTFLNAAGRDLDAAAGTVRAAGDGAQPPAPPARARSLRQRQQDVVAALDAHPDRVGGPEAATLLVDVTDRITNSLDTLRSELRRQGAARPEPALLGGAISDG